MSRRLSIPSPATEFAVASKLVSNWTGLVSQIQKSELSRSVPQPDPTGRRAVIRSHDYYQLEIERLELRAASRFHVYADIARFYESVYTHTIPWVIHGKDVAKARRHDSALFGNELDRVSRRAQDDQTIGIPIGPDRSLIVAEVLLAWVDESLMDRRGGIKGFRSVDDYEFFCSTRAEADDILILLQRLLGEIELSLNPLKTRVIALPAETRKFWVGELRRFSFNQDLILQKHDIVEYFDSAFRWFREFPQDGVLRYALRRLSGATISRENWALLQQLLMQCATSESGCLPYVLAHLVAHRSEIGRKEASDLAIGLSQIVAQRARLGEDSEVAWALWGAIVFDLNVTAKAVDAASVTEDSTTLLLLLDAESQGLTGKSVDRTPFSNRMTVDELWGSQWLLVYEAIGKGWLSPPSGSDPATMDATFGFLRENGISFYDGAAAASDDPVGFWRSAQEMALYGFEAEAKAADREGAPF